jgi:phospholipid/cholesterol/gamma-HCH transport system permease protein
MKANDLSPADASVTFSGALTDAEGARLLKEIEGLLDRKERRIVIDFRAVAAIDSRGGAWLSRAVQRARAAGAEVEMAGANESVGEFIDLIRPSFAPPSAVPRARPGFLERLGEGGLSFRDEFAAAGGLVVDAVYWTFIAPFEGRGVRWKGLWSELHEMGWRAVGIVSLINFLIGVVIAMLSAAQLRLFGVQILVASLVVIGFARELAVVMTGVVVSARTGAAIAAELATMTVSEEIDALKGMGLNVAKFLIAPKVLAILIVMPILTMLGFVMGVAGGFALGIFVLGFTFDRWWAQTLQAVTMNDLMQGFVKSFVFALIIVVVGCYNGLKVTGGARGVGISTTRAVVMDIFLIVVADLVFATLFYLTS